MKVVNTCKQPELRDIYGVRFGTAFRLPTYKKGDLEGDKHITRIGPDTVYILTKGYYEYDADAFRKLVCKCDTSVDYEQRLLAAICVESGNVLGVKIGTMVEVLDGRVMI